MRDLMEPLQLLHSSTLEVLIPPSHTSNSLSWCQTFPSLKNLTLSYVEVMDIFRKYRIHLPTLEKRNDALDGFRLAMCVPERVESVAFIGGRALDVVTSPWSPPIYNDGHDIQDFIDIITVYVSSRGSLVRSNIGDDTSRNLRDICFGDMRVTFKPQNAAIGKKLNLSSTEANEISRLELDKALRESDKLREVCSLNGVRLHFTNLDTRVCDRVDCHPYPPKKRFSRQELIAEAEKLSKDSDMATKSVLSQYIRYISEDHRA